MSPEVLYSFYVLEAFSKEPEPSHLCREARSVPTPLQGMENHTHTCTGPHTHTVHTLFAHHNMYRHQTQAHTFTPPNAHMPDPGTHAHSTPEKNHPHMSDTCVHMNTRHMYSCVSGWGCREAVGWRGHPCLRDPPTGGDYLTPP